MTLEQRVSQLEKQMKQISEALTHQSQDGWEKTLGMFEGDEAMKEIARLGEEWRESERRKARSNGKAKKTKRPAKA